MCLIHSRMSGVRINDLPKFLEAYSDEKTHVIIVYDPLDPKEHLIILLALKGVTSYFLSRKPKASEYDDELVLHIDMTIKALVWEPSDTSFSEQEDTMTAFRGYVLSSGTIARGRRIINYLSVREDHAVDFTDDEKFYKALNAKINVYKVGCSKGINGVTLDSLY